MEDAGKADPGAEMLGIGGDAQERLGGGLEQDAIDLRLVLVGDVGDRRRHGEHDMVILHGQELGLARGEPVPGGRPLALGAMPVAAGVVGDMAVAAVLASRDMAAEGRRAAALDGGHDLELAEAQVTGVGLAPGGAVGAEDIRDLQPFAWHDASALGGLLFLLLGR